jgi:hypothetical protein
MRRCGVAATQGIGVLDGTVLWQQNRKKDSPEPPKPSSKPSRLEGQLDDLRLPGRCCIMMAAR